MREDMFKVIVERPRWGRSWASKSKLRYDKCEERSRVSGHRLVMESTGRTKHLNENLAPLKRYLHKQIGRRWDDVFSEICTHLDTGSTVKMHVREHLDDFVLSNVRHAPDGTLWATGRWGAPETVSDSWTELYVDPSDGIIKETRKLCLKKGVPFKRTRPRHSFGEPKESPQTIKKLSGKTWHAQLKGIWYFVEASSVPLCSQGYVLSDVSIYDALATGAWRDQDKWRVVCKRQLSSKALKGSGLKNTFKIEEGLNYG